MEFGLLATMAYLGSNTDKDEDEKDYSYDKYHFSKLSFIYFKW